MSDNFDPNVLGGSIKRGIVNPVLIEERAKCAFDQTEMRDFMFGKELVELILEQNRWQKEHPELNTGIEYYEMSRDEKFVEWWRRYRLIMESEKMSKNFTGNSSKKLDTFNWSYLYPGLSPLTLHQSMFSESLEAFGTDKQRDHYLPLIDNLNIIGCYAQTELGHGSNVAGLETTATFDHKTDTFVIHSPTIKASKFWPGALGCQSNHAVVFARCICGENDYGVQPFIVQIRDMDTHEPLPGIEVGDIGTKLGYNSIDNGYLKFTHVRVAHNAHLSRFSTITKEGDFELNSDPRLLYQIMSRTRMNIVLGCGFNIFRSAVVAVRYSLCRRQFANQKGTKMERKLLDYQLQQEVLGKNIANGVTIFLAASHVKDMNTIALEEFKEGEFKNLDLMHHLTAGLKSYATEMCYVGLDEMRQSCGGAGFLLSSGLSDWWADVAPFPTFEGVNPVMAQQASRLIFKNARKVAKGKKPHDFFAYLGLIKELVSLKSNATTVEQFLDIDHIEKTLAVRAVDSVKEVSEMMEASTASNKEKENEIFALDVARMTRLHLIYVSFRMARERLDSSELKDQNIKHFLEVGIKTFALKQLLLDNSGLYENGYFNRGSARLLDLAFRQMLTEMRPQMLSFVETFPESHEFVPSTIGNAYGDIYEFQFETAKNSKMNSGVVPSFFETHMKPVMNLRKPQVPKL